MFLLVPAYPGCLGQTAVSLVQVISLILKLINTTTPDKTVLSVSHPLQRCELDSRQRETVAYRKFQSNRSSSSHWRTKHDAERILVVAVFGE